MPPRSTSRAARLAVLVMLASTAALSACGRKEAPQPQQQQAMGGGGGPFGGGPARRGSFDPNRPVPVEIALAELGTAARIVTATGTVEPIRKVAVNSQLAGAIVSLRVEEGNIVGANAVLAQLDSREIEAQLASAQASLVVAQRAAERSTQLRQAQVITAAEYDRDQAALVAARATRDQLRTRLGYATVRAPIAGVLLEKRVERGDVVGNQARLFVIGDVSTLVVRLPISERDVTMLRVGDNVTVVLDAMPGRQIPGQIRRIFPSADSVTRLVPVEVALDASGARDVKPGFLARVTFHLEPREGVLLIPAGAIVEDATGSSVFLVREGRANRRPIQRGGTFQGRVEVIRGISPGDSIVVAGSQTVRDGALIRAVDPPSYTDPGSSRPGATGAMAAPTMGTR